MKKSCLVMQFIASIFLIPFPSSVYAASEDDVIPTYQVTSEKLDNSRNNLSTKTGSSSYSFNKKDIDNLPAGSATPLNQLMLQAPGVTQDSYGQLHVRDDHANLQYRINGVIIPEGINGFGQTLDAHFADHIDLLTGALPAEYGYRTAGVVDIKTKNGSIKNGGRTELTTGSHSTIGGNQELSGSQDRLNYYFNASYLQNNLGIEAPTSHANPIHDFTRQDKQFGYFSYLLDDQNRLTAILSNATNRFQIPNNPGQTPSFTLNNSGDIPSSNLNERQNEYNRYALLALQGTTDSEIDYQLATFTRDSRVIFKPDYNGDLIYNGVASGVNNRSLVNGVQSDLSYKLDDYNTLRSGFTFSSGETKSMTDTAVFPVDANGDQSSSNPQNIAGYSKKHSYLYGAYLQNEWKMLDQLTINFGARYDISQADVNASQLSPRLGAIYDFNKATKIHAGYARYFTPPPTELISNATITQFQGTTNEQPGTTNDKVKPESTNYYDLGVTHKLTKHINLGLDGYYKEIHNMLDEGQFGQALIYTPFNYREAKVYGLEFSSDYHKDNFSAYLNLAAQKAKAKDISSGQYLFESDELNYIANNYVHPDHDQHYTASAGLAYLLYGTNYSVTGIYGSGLRKGFANTEHLPYYTQVNLGAAREFDLPMINKFTGRFSVVNLFDESYQIRDGSGIGVGAPQYGPRRAYYLTVSKSF